MINKYISLSLSIVCLTLSLQAQTVFHNNGEDIFVGEGTFISINGDLILSNGGLIYNEDSILLTGDFENNAGNTGFNINGKGWVHLTGDAQNVGGTDVTAFNNLNLLGTSGKTASIDVDVHNALLLNTKEFDVDSNCVTVYNPDPLSVVFDTNGYINSTYTGGLRRKTNSANAYWYPLGDQILYRPVIVTPTSTDENSVKLSFINNSADGDGFSFLDKDDWICDFNDLYYHEYTHDSGSTPMDVSLFFDPSMNLDINDGAYWDSAQWNDHDTSELINPTPIFNPLSIGEVKMHDFFVSNDLLPVIMSITTEERADAGANDTITEGQSLTIGGAGNAQQDLNGVLFTWTASTDLNNDMSPNPVSTPADDITYALMIETPEGCMFFDTVSITVEELVDPNNPNEPLICRDLPNVITPNGDGRNDVWRIDCLADYPDHELVIFNRYNDEVYGPVDFYNNDWGGTYKEDLLPEGTYFYILKVFTNNEEIVLDGPITIIRE